MKKAGPTNRVSYKKRRRSLRLNPCARVNVESQRVELDSVPATDHALCSHLSMSRTEHRHEEVEHDDGENEQVCLAEDASNKKRGHGESDGGTNKGRNSYCSHHAPHAHTRAQERRSERGLIERPVVKIYVL